MSKLSIDTVKSAIEEIIKGSEEKKRGFVETIELTVNLKDYDTQRDKRFSGSVKLPYNPRPRMKACILADAHHMDEAKKLNIDAMSVEDLKKLNKDKKLVKKLAKKYSFFLASQALLPQIPKLLGPGLNKAGKFPQMLTHKDSIEEKCNDIKTQVKFQLKKDLCMGAAVGHVAMNAQEIRANTVMAINFLVSLLKKNWNNVKSLYLKSTMGKSFRIY